MFCKNVSCWNDHILQTKGITLNVVSADIEGNIGYAATGLIPHRKDEDYGAFIKEGWIKDTDWIRYLPSHEKPHMMNPEKGFISTANN